jgi:hypothetical protein
MQYAMNRRLSGFPATPIPWLARCSIAAHWLTICRHGSHTAGTLKRSPAQEQEMTDLLDPQQDKRSAHYHTL